MLEDILAMPTEELAQYIPHLNDAERLALWQIIEDREKNPWYQYRGDPLGFVEKGLGDTLWSKQQEILEALRIHRRVAVSTVPMVGKSFLAARAVASVLCTWPVPMARATTTATNFRQVRQILWPYIRQLHEQHNLPGEILTTAWKFDGFILGDGFAADKNQESSVQGIHPRGGDLILVIDEAGGIGHTLGKAFNSILQGDAMALAIGNPASDKDGSWFQWICESDRSPWHYIKIPWESTPNFTGEDTPLCTTCGPLIEPHQVKKHLIDQKWVHDVEMEYGKESSYYIARVKAEFPKNTTTKTLPMDWLENCLKMPVDTGRISLGCDIASGGGDEFVIAQADGWNFSILHYSVGEINNDATVVAGKIWEHALEGVRLHAERGIPEKVSVKIDAIGLGWGIVGILQGYVKEQSLSSKVQIIAVNVAEKAHDTVKFANQRSEMWWSFRDLIRPDTTGSKETNENHGASQAFFDFRDREGGKSVKELAQLNAPQFETDSHGRTVVENKESLEKRGIGSPDRAEAILLAAYFPPVKKRDNVPAGIFPELGKANPHHY